MFHKNSFYPHVFMLQSNPSFYIGDILFKMGLHSEANNLFRRKITILFRVTEADGKFYSPLLLEVFLLHVKRAN